MTSMPLSKNDIPKSVELIDLYPDLFNAIFKDNRNVFISGPGGAGKSYTIGKIKNYCDLNNIQCDLTSTTGVSAHALGHGASTIHRFTSINLGDKPIDTIIKNIKTNPEKLARWKKAQILVIDEVSMLGSLILDLISAIGKEIRIGKRKMRTMKKSNIPIPPFGGIQIIFSADMMQLMPIRDKFPFESPVWEELNLYNFRVTHPYRYPDINHFQLLSRVRLGEQTQEDIDMLNKRVVAYKEYMKDGGSLVINDIKPTRIYPLKRDVEDINSMELEKLDGDTSLYEATDCITIKHNDSGEPMIDPENINTQEYAEYMDAIVPYEIGMKPGAQVMLTKNLSVEEGLVNGARGVVESCGDDTIVVKFKCGMTVDITPEEYEYEDEKVTVNRVQFPLMLAWSVSIHKMQGATLDYCIIDLGTSLFACGMGYVALSRCKTVSGIFIVNLIPRMLKANPIALQFEQELIKKSIMAPKVDVN
jgi:ATP-dependent DNA helicase PIF1